MVAVGVGDDATEVFDTGVVGTASFDLGFSNKSVRAGFNGELGFENLP